MLSFRVILKILKYVTEKTRNHFIKFTLYKYTLPILSNGLKFVMIELLLKCELEIK